MSAHDEHLVTRCADGGWIDLKKRRYGATKRMRKRETSITLLNTAAAIFVA
ncbi:MAG TPA: hypothetical protein VME63_00625 [Dyella sp.]|uniref:hypothetical protein n=1 Tax=Dyella sp. TaxID=1869338 RepID=UPI002C4384C2|nr:hypothetical protein [Dyella sp.]HTV83880.1 hypothetical protein [Dyella sp.]